MRLQNKVGDSAEFVAWNLSCNEQSYVVVALEDGQLQEWKLNDCRVIGIRKTSEPVDLAATTANTGSPKCEQCEHFDLSQNVYTVECYSCKRYCVDLFTLRASA